MSQADLPISHLGDSSSGPVRAGTVWRQPVRRNHGLGALFLGRQETDRLTSEQRHRAQILRIEIAGHPLGDIKDEIERTVGPIMPLPVRALRFSDLETLEKAVLRLRPRREVEQSMPALKARLASVDPTFDLGFLEPKGEEWDEADLRSAAKYAVTMVYERETDDIVQARKRYDLLRFTGNVAAVLALLFLAMVAGRVDHWFQKYGIDPPFDESGHLLISTMIVGGLGGVMSAFITLGNVSTVQGLGRKSNNTRTLKFSVLVHLIGGFVFLMVMFMLLLGGFLQGSVLPDMGSIDKLIGVRPAGTPAVDFFTTEMAKLIVWAFISGYIGGLIPSQLAKIGRGIGAAESRATASPSS